MFNFFKKIIIIFVLIFTVFPVAYAAEITIDEVNYLEAIVISIDNVKTEDNSFTGRKGDIQTLTIKLLSGDKKGELMSIENDYNPLEKGDKFFIKHIVRADDNTDIYLVDEPNRVGPIIFFTILFLIVLFIFGGIQGLRGLLSLVGSLFLIIYVLIPSLLQGYSPVLVSLVVSSIIIIVGSFITHGFNKTTFSAVLGMIAVVIITGTLAHFAVEATRLTGYASEESVYLNYNTGGRIDMAGLLLGGILIGLLGVLYDAAISQAVSIEELIRANNKMSKKVLYQRAMRIGREHIGALVDTLAIAYVGASLPLLLLFSSAGSESIKFTLSRELFASEIIRTLVGSIGLILAVPITTFISILILKNAKNLPHSTHTHTHTH